MGDRLCAAVCSGKDCRKRPGYRELRAALAAVADVEPTRCLDLCHGPVAVVAPRTADALVFEKLRTPEQHVALVQLVAAGAPPAARRAKPGRHLGAPLAARLVTGKARRKALAVLAKRKSKRASPDR